MLEVCIDSLESAINAVHGGADELEVCSSLPVGGLTPSPGLVREILKMVDNISCEKPIDKNCMQFCCKNIKKPKVNIMIRCRAGSDFCYTIQEMNTMLSDIECYKTLNINRFVFGALNENLQVDEENCQKVITTANPIPVTFHRAFDLCVNPSINLDRIINLGFTRLLTSGQQKFASDPKAVDFLHKLLMLSNGRVEIMPGSGVNEINAKDFINIGFNIIHGSCKRSQEMNIRSHLSMGISSTEYIYYTDENLVRKLKEVLTKAVDEKAKGN